MQTLTLIVLNLALFSLTTSLLLPPDIHKCHPKAGLITTEQMPLKILSLETNVNISGPYAEIEYIQKYQNPFEQAVETEYYFPRTEHSVFHKFEGSLKGKTIVGKILPKEEAKQSYEENKQQGNTVAFAEINEKVPDVMKIMVGNIPVGETIEIRFSILEPLDIVLNKFWSFTLLSTLTPRYTPHDMSSGEIPDVSCVPFKDSNLESWKINIRIGSNDPFEVIKNPSHHMEPVIKSGNGENWAIFEGNIPLNKDFVVYWSGKKVHEPLVILAEHPEFPKDNILSISFFPEMNDIPVLKASEMLFLAQKPKDLETHTLTDDIRTSKGEFIFVIDRSGSMHGDRIQNLKHALSKFLTILPEDCYFNIISYGSNYAFYQQESVKYNKESQEKVLAWINSIDADFGGTEIYAPVRAVTELPVKKGYPRTVIILTDGEVNNPDQIIGLVKEYSEKMRFCSIGLGHGSSNYLIKNIGKAGRCTSEFVKDEENLADKTLYILQAAISHTLENVMFDMACFDASNQLVYSTTENLGYIIKNQAFKKWVYFPNSQGIHRCNAKIEYTSSFLKKKLSHKFSVDNFETAERTDIWHKIGYFEKIQDLTFQAKSAPFGTSEEIISQIRNISIKYQVLSEYTAFLTVIEENTAESGPKKKILIPNVLSADYEDIHLRHLSAQTMLFSTKQGAPRASSFIHKKMASRDGVPIHANLDYGMENAKGSRMPDAQLELNSKDNLLLSISFGTNTEIKKIVNKGENVPTTKSLILQASSFRKIEDKIQIVFYFGDNEEVSANLKLAEILIPITNLSDYINIKVEVGRNENLHIIIQNTVTLDRVDEEISLKAADLKIDENLFKKLAGKTDSSYVNTDL